VTSRAANFPGAYALDFTAAYRMEDYSDAGESRVPKFGLRWLPFDEQLAFRYTYGRGFAAPTPFSMFGPTTQGTSGNVSAALGLSDGVSRFVNVRSGANAGLKPTKSESHAVGFVLAPKSLRGLKVSVDYHDVELTNVIGTAGTNTILQSVNQAGTASPYISQVALNAFPGNAGAVPITSAGQLAAHVQAGNSPNTIYVSDTRRNIASAILRIVDVDVSYRLRTAAAGDVELGTRGSFFLDDKIQALPTESYHEYAGLVTSAEGTIPGYRFYSTALWTLGAWEFGVANTYIPGVDDLGAGGTTFAGSTTLRRTPVSSYTSWDVSVAWALWPDQKSPASTVAERLAAKLRVGVNNLANKMPPLARQAYGTPNPNVDASTYSPIGRLYYVSADFRF
jgi:iron complex outermembrane recepter protein